MGEARPARPPTDPAVPPGGDRPTPPDTLGANR